MDARREGQDMDEASFLNTLSTYHDRMKQARVQETKDSIICQLVLPLLHFVPSQEIRDKFKEILQEYNSEERIQWLLTLLSNHTFFMNGHEVTVTIGEIDVYGVQHVELETDRDSVRLGFPV